MPPGTLGTVTSEVPGFSPIHDGQVWVDWDNGSRLALLVGEDEWEVVDDEEST